MQRYKKNPRLMIFLDDLMAQRKVGPGELSRQTGVSAQMICSIKSGSAVPGGRSLIALLEAFGCQPADLLRFEHAEHKIAA